MDLREATIEDAKLLFAYRNEEQTRQNSKHTDLVKWEDHLAWLQKRIGTTDCQIFIAEENQIPIGQIRLDIMDNTAIISYSIDTPYRGQGYGTTLLKTLELEVVTINSKLGSNTIGTLNKMCITTLLAEVKQTNLASQRCFESLGYHIIFNQEGILTYQKQLPVA